jgi:hypothetical protein
LLKKLKMIACSLAALLVSITVHCAEPTRETFISKPKADWPQIVLTNSASFHGHTPLYGASAFLLKTPNGEVLAVTARHLLGENGGVEPEIAAARLEKVLKEWLLFPRTEQDRTIHVIGLAPISTKSPDTDWLVLRVDQKTLPAKITPLRLRTTPVEVGETVFLIGVSYDQPEVSQKVYSGKITQRTEGDRFRFNIQPYVDIRGFSGAPVIDKDGFVVGVTSIWFEPKMDGELWTESGAEGVASVASLLK